MRSRMSFDDVAWERSDQMFDEWKKDLFKPDNLRAIGLLVGKHCQGRPVEVCAPVTGSFNVCVRVKFDDGGSAMIRFPIPGSAMFLEEKVRNEVALIRYLQWHTSIPVPFILHWGTKKESPGGLGPFIIMDYIEHATDLGAALSAPRDSDDDRPILDANIGREKLEKLYGQLADILLQLSRLSLPKIGSLSQVDEHIWEVARRPLSLHMNELVRLGTLPRQKLPSSSTVFDSADSYFNTLADLHIAHLTSQRNDAIGSESDCYRKYVARYLFRKLAKEGRLTSPTNPPGTFKIWCDDLRPTNVLLNSNLQVVGVIDWEFTYAAPIEFSHAPPWWLLVEQPEYWPDGITEWTSAYAPRLQTFLKVLRDHENVAIEHGLMEEHQRLSGPMEESWNTGAFWISYAARKNFAFDAIFWQQLDSRFFGRSTGSEGDRWKQRIGLLDEAERRNLDGLVNKKMESMKTRALEWEPDETEAF